MTVQSLSIFTGFRLGLGFLALVAVMFTGTTPIGRAQTGSGSPPPTYDFDDMAPGVQGPTSPLLANAEVREFRIFSPMVPVRVPLAELQAALPPGFMAIASPAGSNTAQVILAFRFQHRATRLSDGRSSGPGSGVGVQFAAMNTNLTPNRQETLTFQEFSSQELVDHFNAVYGPGAARLAKVNVQITEDGAILSLRFQVTDDELGFDISAQITSTGPMIERRRSDPAGTVFRSLISQQSSRISVQGDYLVVPQQMANVNVSGKLAVPIAGGGSRSLTISSIGANITFIANQEVYQKQE